MGQPTVVRSANIGAQDLPKKVMHGRCGPEKPGVTVRGDETAIMHCMNLGVHSDRRLFLCDVGNDCIRSVKLEYHTEERVKVGR